MTYSLILIDVENKLNLQEFLQYKMLNLPKETEVIYCCSKEPDIKYQDTRCYVFDKNENVEKIVNAVIRKCTCPNIILARNVNLYKYIKELINHHKCSNQIVYLKQKMSKLGNFWFNLVKKTVGKILSHNLLPMDHGLALYGEMASKVLTNVVSPSVLLRTNNWSGIDTVAVDGGTKYKFKYNRAKSALITLTPLAIAVIMLVIKLVARIQMFQTITVVYYSIIVFCLMFFVIFGCKWILNSLLGENITDKAKIIN